ncbi:MAG: hypothetical protein QNK36_04135 [Colwellia sp.]|nr:hypothetical protein [Colwellia sp.]
MSGEINTKIGDPKEPITQVAEYYQNDALVIYETYGLSMGFKLWRFNLCCSNTETLLRLNVESRGNNKLTAEKTQ